MRYFFFLKNIFLSFRFILKLLIYVVDTIIYMLLKSFSYLSIVEFNFFSGQRNINISNKFINKFFLKKFLEAPIILTHPKIVERDTLIHYVFNFIKYAKYNIKYFNDFIVVKNFFRFTQTRLGIYNYINFSKNFVMFYEIFLLNIFIGLKYLIKFFRFWLLPIFFSISLVYISVLIKTLPFNKVIFGWLAVFMILYWLLSGFVFFFKKYQYSKYTSAIQRFWRRSYILFWLLESCLLLVFIYLTFIASQESFYMFDTIQIYKTHLFSWRFFFFKIFPLVLLIVLAYFFLLNLKWNTFSKHSSWLLIFTIILTYLIWIEFYQFFHIVNFYGNLTWNYDFDEKFWNLELEARRTRIINHYIMWLLILKFWHLLFVYGFWLFLILRALEKKQLRYPLFSANQQNLIILFIMSWLFMFPWFKIYFRKFMDIPYFWFYINNRSLLIRNFFNDIKIYWYGLCNLQIINIIYSNYYFQSIPFFYWLETNKLLILNQTKKHFIRNQIITLFLQ